MSGDVQPRKRKDKKRKRDSLDRRSEGDFVFTRKQSLQEDEPREQHQGVHGSKMGNEDVHLHVQGDHETGGHWCAKIFFFSLLAILLGLIGLIILENRGLADLDTPLSESRFSNYFDGWVDEHREAHDEHDAVSASIEEHEHGDEPFEEEEDHSEIDEAEDDDDEKDHDEEDEEEEDYEEDTKENEEENDNETEEVEAETAEEADDETQEEEEENDDENTVEDSAEETKEDEEEEADNKNANDDDNEDEDTQENDDNRDDEDEEDEDTTEDVEPIQTRSHQSSHQASSAQSKTKEEDDDDEPFEEEDDDGTFESLESVVVDNDAEELLLLQEKARQQQASAKKGEPEPEEEPSSYSSPQIKPRGGGPQAMDDDEFEEELKKANEEMLRENLNSALNLFESLSHKFPDKPEAFLGKAKILDKQSEIHRSNSKLGEALDAYKRYLAFGEDILNDTEFSEVAQRCVDRMRFMGVNLQAVPIHEMLIERFPNKVSHRNQLAVTYLMVNRSETCTGRHLSSMAK